jgi:hypothetical protein
MRFLFGAVFAAVSAMTIKYNVRAETCYDQVHRQSRRERALNVLRGHSADSRCQGWIVSRAKYLMLLARPARFELTTSAFGGLRGIHERPQPV